MTVSTLLGAVIVIAILGVVVWAIQRYVPMPEWARGLITVCCVLFVLLWLLGVVTGSVHVRLGP